MNIFRLVKRLLAQRRAPRTGARIPQPGVVSTSLPRLSTPSATRIPSFFLPLFWFSSEPEKLSAAATEIAKVAAPGFHFADNLITWGRNLSMLDDHTFVEAWRGNIVDPSDEAIVWRRYVLACAAYHCVQLEGDFVECGAYTGVGMKTIIDFLGGTAFPKTFWGYDVFQHDESMANHSMPRHGADLHGFVVRKFENYPQVKIVKGLIPAVFEKNCPERVAYLHIDLNQAAAEIDALEHLFDRVVPGGIIILDDYEWAGIYRDQKLIEDIWFDARSYKVMALPTGQGLVIKR